MLVVVRARPGRRSKRLMSVDRAASTAASRLAIVGSRYGNRDSPNPPFMEHYVRLKSYEGDQSTGKVCVPRWLF